MASRYPRREGEQLAACSGRRSANVHFMSRTGEWSTPQWLFDTLDAEFHFTLDPCANARNAKCLNYFTTAQDGLKQDWGKHTVFMNPPYGKAIGNWMRKAVESARRGATVVCLVPARTDTRWWHEFAVKGEVRFLKGRVTFAGAQNSAPFPSAVVVLRFPNVETLKDPIQRMTPAGGGLPSG